MLSCPRCGTCNLKEGRSFSMHLARFCSGPTLLCHAQPGLLQSKRSYEQMLSKSSCTTFEQQIRAFNSMTSDVSLPTRNPLHSIPSLLHQSSTQSKLEHQMLITMILTLTIPHQNHLQINLWIMVMQFKFLSLINATFSKIQCGFRLILLFKFIWCLKWMNTEVIIWTCSMKS
jgi:hypothetical protein